MSERLIAIILGASAALIAAGLLALFELPSWLHRRRLRKYRKTIVEHASRRPLGL